MKLITLYKQILEVGNMHADKDGFISGKMKSADKDSPVTIKGKRLVLPTKHQLTLPDWSDRIVFHPLYENVLRGESQVIEKLRNLITMRLNFTIGVLGTALLQLAASTDEHSKLNPDQSTFLAKVRMLDEKCVQTFIKVLDNLDPVDGKTNFVYVFLKRSGVVLGKKHARVGIVTFPIFQEIATKDTAAGIKLRNKDKEVFKNLLEYVFPKIVDDGGYNAGSDSSVAPYTDAMMRTFLNIIAPVNDVIDLFKDIYPDLEDLRFDCEWVEELDKLDKYHVDIKSIPMQAGNEGSSLIKGVAPTQEQQDRPEQPLQQVIEPPPPPPQQVAPVVNQQPWLQPHQFQQNQQVQQTNWQSYSPGQFPPGPTGIVKTKDGADFASILASVPGLAAQTHAFAHPGNQVFQQQQQVPRFAQPQYNTGVVSGFNQYPNAGFPGTGRVMI